MLDNRRPTWRQGSKFAPAIDSENVKGLLLINGGRAVALLAFLPSILGKPEYGALVRAVIWGLMCFQAGLVFAVLHNHLRRRCSLVWDNDKKSCKLRGKEMFEPCICYWSHLFMALSALGFVIAGIMIFCGALQTLNSLESSANAAAPQHKTQIMLPNHALYLTAVSLAPIIANFTAVR